MTLLVLWQLKKWLIFIKIENKYKSLQYPSGGSHFLPPLQTLYSPCVCGWSSAPDVEEAGGSGGQQRGSGWKKWENVREKFPSCPHLAQRCVCLGLYNENGSEKKPNRGGGINLFCDALQAWTCLKSSAVWVYSHPRPISTKTGTINPLHRNFWNPGIFSETEVTWTRSSSLEDLFIAAPCVTVGWRSKVRSQHRILASVCWAFQETPRERHELWGKLGTFAREEPFILLLYFVQNEPFFSQTRGFPTFIPTGSSFLHSQSGGLSSSQCLGLAGSSQCLQMPGVLLLNPGLCFTGRGQASTQKALPGN